MRASLRKLTWLPILLWGATTCAAQEPEVQCGVDRPRVYEGESIIYEVFVRNVESPSEPELEGFDAFRVRLLSVIPQNSRSVMIINGRRSENNRFGTVFRYRLQPRETGELRIPPPVVDVDGITYTGDAVDITVIPPTDQNIVLLEVSADRTSVYRLQPFEVTLRLLIRQLPGDYAEISPLSVQRQARRPNVSVEVPWLAEEVSDDVQSEQSVGDIVNDIITSSSDGLFINNLQADTGFLLQRRKAVFQPRNRVVQRTLADGSPAQFVEYTLSRRFQATRSARIDFLPSVAKGVFAESVTDDGRLNAIEVFAVSNKLSVDVKSPPLDGRPESFTGAIGEFDISASLTPVTASVGDPLTLEVRVTGAGTINDIRPPDIAANREFAEAFRIYEPSEKTTPAGKTFTWSLRATAAAVTEVPEIPFAFFDVTTEDYREVTTAAIPVSIAAARELDSTNIVAATPAAENATPLEQTATTLFANHATVASRSVFRLKPAEWFMLWGCMVGTALVLAGVVSRRQRQAADPARTRRRQAATRAQAVMQDAAAATTSRAQLDGMTRAVTGLIADYANCSHDGLTSGDVAARLADWQIPEELRQQTVQFLEDCDAARYGAESAGEDRVALCRTLLNQLAAELDRRS